MSHLSEHYQISGKRLWIGIKQLEELLNHHPNKKRNWLETILYLQMSKWMQNF